LQIPDMRRLLEGLRNERQNEGLETPVMRVWECQKSMNRASAVLALKRITRHDLRHLFATWRIESGVDIPTVIRWLGHKDSGALATNIDEHPVAVAQKVTFSTAQVPRQVNASPSNS
jgi:integrase